jgi:hypothetical protein
MGSFVRHLSLRRALAAVVTLVALGVVAPAAAGPIETGVNGCAVRSYADGLHYCYFTAAPGYYHLVINVSYGRHAWADVHCNEQTADQPPALGGEVDSTYDAGTDYWGGTTVVWPRHLAGACVLRATRDLGYVDATVYYDGRGTDLAGTHADVDQCLLATSGDGVHQCTFTAAAGHYALYLAHRDGRHAWADVRCNTQPATAPPLLAVDAWATYRPESDQWASSTTSESGWFAGGVCVLRVWRDAGDVLAMVYGSHA